MKTKTIGYLSFVILHLSFFLCLGTAKADYLYWMVTQDPASGHQFDYATIRPTESSSYLCLADPDSGTTLGQSMVLGENAPSSLSYSTGAVYTDLAGYDGAGSTYIVELWLGWGGSAAVIAIKNLDWEAISRNTYASMAPIGSGDPFLADGFTAVPEPTGGMLILLGVAALALRRRAKAGFGCGFES